MDGGQAIEIRNKRARIVEHYLAAPSEGQAADRAPEPRFAQEGKKLVKGFFAFEAHNTVELREEFHGLFGAEAGEVPSGGEMRIHAIAPQVLHQSAKLVDRMLEDQGIAHHPGAETSDESECLLVEAPAEGKKERASAASVEIRNKGPQSKIFLVLVSEQDGINSARIGHGYLPPGRGAISARILSLQACRETTAGESAEVPVRLPFGLSFYFVIPAIFSNSAVFCASILAISCDICA